MTRQQEAGNSDYVPSEFIWFKQKWEHELVLCYEIDDRFEFYSGVNNLFDTKPDVGAVAYPISATGLSFCVGVKAKIF